MILLIIYLIFGLAAIVLLIYDMIDAYKISGLTIADLFFMFWIFLIGPIAFIALVIETDFINDLGKLMEKILEFKIIKPSKNK